MSKPSYVDNRDGHTLAAALRALVADKSCMDEPLDIATGYVNVGGFAAIEDVLGSRPACRLMIGAEPLSPLDGASPGGGGPLGAGVRSGLADLERQLTEDRDALPFSAATAQQVVRFADYLRRPDVQVRRYEERFLHGKVYLFPGQAVLAGSNNLTAGGLEHNLEFALANYNPDAYGAAQRWFDDLWSEAADYRERLIELLTMRETQVWTPHDIYLRALLELYRDELDLLRDDGLYEPGQPAGVSLADFQRHGVQRALRILDRFDGVIIGDGVGLGKSYIGSKLLEHYVKSEGRRALVIVPAALRDSFWETHLRQEQIPAEVVSYQELASEEQLGGNVRRLASLKDSYGFILVDEAHAFRNPDTGQYRALSRLMGGTRKRLCLMTATPVNNTVFDLYHQIMLFARHTARFATIGVPNLTEYFKRAHAGTGEGAAMFGLMDAISVRRTRRFIKQHYRTAVINGQPIRFPNPVLRTVRYDLDRSFPGLFDRVGRETDALTLARYQPDNYRLDGGEDARQRALAGILRTSLLKRFESSAHAFRMTVAKMAAANEEFLAALDAGRVLVPGSSAREGTEEDDPALAAEALGAVGAPAAEYDMERLRADVDADLAILRGFAAAVADVTAGSDPKLAELATLLRDRLGPEKAIVFSLYADTIDWIEQALNEDATRRFGSRRFVKVTGTETATTKQRLEAVHAFCPQTTLEETGGGTVDPADERDLLLATDVLAEGQNLQQARYIVNYDMPWNPMRLVQRNGRIDRIGSPFADQDVYLFNLFPAGDLDRILGLYERLLRKIGAANITVGMEAPVFEDTAAVERNFAGTAAQIRGIADEEIAILDQAEAKLDAFSGEEFRMELRSALVANRIEELEAIPHGAGSGFRNPTMPEAATGVFFGVRLLLGPRPRPDDRHDQRGWRYIDLADADTPVTDELEILDRIRCSPGEPRDMPDGFAPTLYDLWERVQRSVIDEVNERLDPAVAATRIPQSHLWAIDHLAAQANALTEAGVADAAIRNADAALRVDRGPIVQRMLNRPRQLLADSEMSAAEAAHEILKVVDDQGLRPVDDAAESRVRLTPERVRLVCYQVVRG